MAWGPGTVTFAVSVAALVLGLVVRRRNADAERRAVLEGFHLAQAVPANVDAAEAERLDLSRAERASALRVLGMQRPAQIQEGRVLAGAWRIGALAGCHAATASTQEILAAYAATQPFRSLRDDALRSERLSIAQLRTIAQLDRPDDD